MNRINIVSTLQTPAPSKQPSARTWLENQSGISCKSIMSNLSESISMYQQNLAQFQQYLQVSIDKNNKIRGKCQNSLVNGVTKLKSKFNQFANQWKHELPNVCQQFMEIVQKICKLYQQEIQRLTQTNQKWQFSYQQLLKATNLQISDNINQPSAKKEKQGTKSNNQKLINIAKQIQRCKTPENDNPNQCQKSMNNDLAKPNQSQNKNQPLNQVQLKHLCKLDDFIKIKDSEISQMREQITELFEEQSMMDKSDHKHNKIHCKILTEEIKIIDEIKQFRLKTSSDQKAYSNQPPNNSLQNTKNFSSQNNPKSQMNSRKNSFSHTGIKETNNWLQNNPNLVSSSSNCAMKLNKTNTYGRQNSQFTFKQRSSVQPRQRVKEEERQKQQKQKQRTCGSKLQDLKRNLYKNKTLSEYRF